MTGRFGPDVRGQRQRHLSDRHRQSCHRIAEQLLFGGTARLLHGLAYRARLVVREAVAHVIGRKVVIEQRPDLKGAKASLDAAEDL